MGPGRPHHLRVARAGLERPALAGEGSELGNAKEDPAQRHGSDVSRVDCIIKPSFEDGPELRGSSRSRPGSTAGAGRGRRRRSSRRRRLSAQCQGRPLGS
jgi:hypothetical protein